MTIFERLGFNFDSSKFGDAEELSQKSIDYYTTVSTPLKDWQYDDIVNSSAGRGQYFRNPVADVCDEIKIVSDLMSANSTNVDFTNNQSTGNLISGTAASLSTNIVAFKSHTNNVSGVSTESMSYGVPSYDMMVAVGNEVTKLLVVEEEISNTSGVLGSATSLFVEDELQEYLTILTDDLALLDGSISISTVPDPEDPNTTIQIYESNLSSAQVTSLYNNVSTVSTFVNTRKTHDWDFFQNSLNVLVDLGSVTRFSFVGNTQIYLINNYIGTEKLKNIIANT